MEDHKSAMQYKEGQQLLFNTSLRIIPFNIIIASLLAIELSYNHDSTKLIIIWLAVMIIVSAIRLIHSKFVISKQLIDGSANFNLKVLVLLSFLTGLIWTSIYFLSIPYISEQQLYLIILVFGGMSVGAVTSLAVYPPAFFAYILPIFIPVILYNFLSGLQNVILATMLTFFILSISIIARTHKKSLEVIFSLTEENKILIDKFEVLSITDALTGLYNRRDFTQIIQEEYARSKRNQQSLVLVSIDIDNFKLINDNFGHPFGDKFLIYTANYLKHYFRRINDMIFRLGGDEFAALFVNVTEEYAKNICEEIKSQFIKNPKFEYEPQDGGHQKVLEQVSLSMGVVYVPYDLSIKLNEIIEKADQLLYQAKSEGKNKIKYAKGL